MSKASVGRDTCFLSAMQLLLQALGLMLNVFLTRRIGAAQLGVVTLISTLPEADFPPLPKAVKGMEAQ